jgi:2-phospho-L-lactate/phosphoenolpyruvate guanylyltransferase
MIVVAVPIKDLSAAKQRLAGVLTLAERDQLARAMLRDVLRALAAADLDRVWVVTREPAAAAIARALGAEPLVEAENRGHTAAVALAQAEAARRAARVFLTVPGDVPRVTADEVRALARAATRGVPAFVPSRSGLGTNGVALAPPDAMALTFGEPSFARHLETARRHGLAPRILPLPGLGLDIDGPEDLTALLAEVADTETAQVVSTWLAADASRFFVAGSARPARTEGGLTPIRPGPDTPGLSGASPASRTRRP